MIGYLVGHAGCLGKEEFTTLQQGAVDGLMSFHLTVLSFAGWV